MKKLLAMILIAAFALALTACVNPLGGNNGDLGDLGELIEGLEGLEGVTGSNTEGGDNEGNSGGNASTAGPGATYESAYTFYTAMVEEMGNRVSDIVDDHNATLEESNPDGYLNDPNYYLMFSYMPFFSMDMAFTATISDESDAAGIAMAYSIFGAEDVNFETIGPGEYKISYKFTDEDDGTVKSYEDLASYSDGSIRYEQLLNGETDEFYEFINLGNDRYAIQSQTGRAIVMYKDGEITQLLHSSNKYESDYETGEVTDWSVVYDSKVDSAWGKTSLNESWVMEKGEDAFVTVYRLENGTLTISGFDKNTDWETGEVAFEPMTPIVMTVTE